MNQYPTGSTFPSVMVESLPEHFAELCTTGTFTGGDCRASLTVCNARGAGLMTCSAHLDVTTLVVAVLINGNDAIRLRELFATHTAQTQAGNATALIAEELGVDEDGQTGGTEAPYVSRLLPPRDAVCARPGCGHTGADHHHGDTKCWAHLPRTRDAFGVMSPVTICECPGFLAAGEGNQSGDDGFGETPGEYRLSTKADAPAEDLSGQHPFEEEWMSEAAAKRRLPNCSVCKKPATDSAHDGDQSPETRHLRALLTA